MATLNDFEQREKDKHTKKRNGTRTERQLCRYVYYLQWNKRQTITKFESERARGTEEIRDLTARIECCVLVRFFFFFFEVSSVSHASRLALILTREKTTTTTTRRNLYTKRILIGRTERRSRRRNPLCVRSKSLGTKKKTYPIHVLLI